MAIAPLSPGTPLGVDASGSARYVVQSTIASTGFGHTYLASRVRLGGQVVVKELAPPALAQRAMGSLRMEVGPAQRPEFVRALARFVREGQFLFQVQHPNVVQVLDCWRENESAYLATVWVPESHPLTYGSVAHLAVDERLRILDRVLDALQAIHDQRIVHGDIKPLNVLLSRDGRPVLVDFGIARTADELSQETRHAFFTEGWAAPEWMQSSTLHAAGPWSDLFAWGLLAIEVLQGHPGGAPRGPLERIQQDPYVDCRRVLRAAGVPDGWATAIERAVMLDPAKRPRSVADLRAIAFAAPPAPARRPTPMVRVCDGCGRANPAETHFCTRCGLELAEAPIAMALEGIPRTGQRLAASAVDAVIQGILMYGVIAGIAGAVDPASPPPSPAEADALAVFVLLLLVGIHIAYHVLGAWLFHGSIGKLIFRLRIVRADLGRPSLGQLAGRSLLRAFTLLTFGYGFLWIWLNPKRRAAHDYLSGTILVRMLPSDGQGAR